MQVVGSASSSSSPIIIQGIVTALVSATVALAVVSGFTVAVVHVSNSNSNTNNNNNDNNGYLSTTPTIVESTTSSLYLAYNRSCESTNYTCNLSLGLACIDGLCECNSTSYWSSESNACMSCQTGWNGYGKTCWRLFTQLKLSWAQAAETCASYSAKLMVIKDETKFTKIQNYFINDSRGGERKQAWLNSRTSNPLVFTWPNGDSIAQSFWGLNNPNNGDQGTSELVEGCVSMSSNVAFKLDDISCSSENFYFCEY